jgi:pyridoxamine 5'-phosphate oxidase
MEKSDPIQLFRTSFEKALKTESHDATAATLATADSKGRVSSRLVLVKHFDDRGFVFYTNRNSRKGKVLAENPQAALCFYWPALEEQVRIEGAVEHVSEEESDAYFATRNRGSQLGAWASHQSEELDNRAELVARYMQLKVKYAARDVPRPQHWGGYRIIPDRIEFWRAGTFRLHDRFLFTRSPEGWKRVRLYP